MSLFRENVPLDGRNTMQLKVSASFWAEFSDPLHLATLIEECRRRCLPWYVLGGGSNVVLTGNFPGTYLHPASGRIEHESDTLLVADAGVVWDDFVAYCVERGLWGVENLSLIPGQVGAAPIQNIGAYGCEAGNAIEWVEYFDTVSLRVKRMPAAECGFGYRSSVFKSRFRDAAIVTRVAFRLSREAVPNMGYGDLRERVEVLGGPSLANVRQAVTDKIGRVHV